MTNTPEPKLWLCGITQNRRDDIDEMTKPLSIKEKEVAVTGDDITMSAIMWASTQDEFGSIDEVIRQLETGETSINGLVNAYMDAKGDMSITHEEVIVKQ